MSEAQPQFVPYPKAPQDAPNVLIVVLDDIGFAQLGCFGAPIRTPHIDGLASEGLRYNRFHVTSICSSTRAALLSGRNHHAVGIGMTMETPLGFPGYTGRLPASAALLPRILRDNGYSTLAVGKWHLCPRGEYSQSGPMTRWPLGVGFERYYGFLGAETNQWAPELCRDNTLVDPPRSPAEGYHLTEDLVDEAIRMITDQRQATPRKPWFCWVATGAAHAPHQVPEEWSAAYQGEFDSGWESVREHTFARQRGSGVVPDSTVLTQRPPWIPPWEELSAGERRLFARYMEVFAGFVTHTDAHLGRLFDFLEAHGELDDTVVMVLSDNGASAEGSSTGTLNEPAAWLGNPESVAEALGRIDEIGGRRAFNHYPFGWAWTGNTPLQLWKRYAWLGGVRTPLIVRLPNCGVAGAGSVRRQFCHAVDVFPTVLELAGIEAPVEVDGVPQQRVDGSSLVATFSDPDAPAPRRTQYFEMHGSRGLYHDGWKVTTDYVSPMFGERSVITGSDDFDRDRWCLFNLDDDFAEAVDLADRFPERVAELERIWWEEAERNQVLPLFEGPKSLAALHPAEFPQPAEAVYLPGTSPIYEGVMPPLFGGFTAIAEIDSPSGSPSGVVCALGDLNEGWAFYLLDGRPCTCLVSMGHTTRVAGDRPVEAGARTVAVEFRPSAPGDDNLRILVDGEVVAGGHHPGAVVFAAQATAGGGLLVGRDRGLAVCDDYEPPFALDASLRRLVIRSGAPDSRRDPKEVARVATASD